MQEMLEKARMRDTGVKLEVNEKILDSVTKLMAEIQQLVRKSKVLQEEIVRDSDFRQSRSFLHII